MKAFFVIVLFGFALFATAADIQLPEGFAWSKFAGDDLAHDIWCMTLDSEDRVCVGGPGYIKFLIDKDGDGTADEAKLFTKVDRAGPMGLLIDGKFLYSVEATAVVRYTDANGDMKADGPGEVLVEFTGKGGEHGPHGICKGPDGWFYIVCGNNTGINAGHANLPDSPIKSPNQGCILRIHPDGAGTEIVAHGFRNPYDIAFDHEGRLFTYDSDNERDHHLPWYAHTRVFDVAFGRHHGWLNPGHVQSYNTPEYYTIDRLAEVRRGSPTGVEYYWHDTFPGKYRNGLFHACWTFGQIYFSPLQWEQEEGLLLEERTYKRQQPEIFAQSGEQGGFAPVDLAVDSRGNLWVACGGRNTSGNVYRIWSKEKTGVRKQRKLPSLPKSMVGRRVPKPALQHPHTVRTFLKDPQDLHLVYQAFQDRKGGINHLPQPRSIDAGYCFSFNETAEALELEQMIIAESGAGLLLDMDLKAEDALTKDAEELAAFWEAQGAVSYIEPWRSRNYRELARTLGCVKTEFAPVLENLTTALREDTHPTDDIHYLFCLAQIPAPRTSIATWRIATAFLMVDGKLAAIPGAHPSRNWSLRLKDLFAVHCELSSNLGNEVMWSHSRFGSTIAHSRYIETIKDPDLKKEVIAKMYRRLKHSKEEWTIEWAKLLNSSGPELSLGEIRRIWDEQPRVRTETASWLLKIADPSEDRARLFEVISLGNAGLSRKAAGQVSDIDLDQKETETVLTALVRHHKDKKTTASLLSLLGEESTETALANAKSKYGKSSVIIQLAGAADWDSFVSRLSKVKWGAGRVAEGEKVFTRLGCAACHGGQTRLGPSMKGVAARFGRDDFFKHTFNPNLAISDLYKAIEITTKDGEKYSGVPVYTSPDQTILEIGPGQTVNFSQGEILTNQGATFSPMPGGLLLGASDQDLADLWEWVKTQ